MFLSAYHFTGEPDRLLKAYELFIAAFPPDSLDLHVCVRREGGITIFDACPSRAVFEGFSSGDAFRAAIAMAGLPAPRIEPLGDVHAAHTRQAVVR